MVGLSIILQDLRRSSVADCGDSIYAMQTHVFENKELTMAQLKDALDHNFGCGCCETASDDEARIYEAVKRILSSNGSIDISALQSQLSASQTANAGDGEYARIKRIMENTTWYGNDVDDVDLLARRCGQIYSREVEKYKTQEAEYTRQDAILYRLMYCLERMLELCLTDVLQKQPLADGVSPRQGKDTNGPTAAAMSVAKLDHENYSMVHCITRSSFHLPCNGDEGLKRFQQWCVPL